LFVGKSKKSSLMNKNFHRMR